MKDLRELLPKVGDIRMETMTVSDREDRPAPERCVVEQVNEKRLWYRVRFERTGTCECYKLPVNRRTEGHYAAPRD